jgi:hypothetical protein
MVEGGYKRDGKAWNPPMNTGPELSGHQSLLAAYFILGVTPNGHYGPAINTGPLRDGWEWTTRVEAARATPPAGAGSTTNWWGVTTALHWEWVPQLRMQLDLNYQKFDKNAAPENAGFSRIYAQAWMTFRF